jgi:3-oxoacyl-[acyl-carrier-protein] synthase-3
MPATVETVENRLHYARQDGQTVFKNAVFNMADVSEKILERNNLTGEDVQWLAAHQANKRIVEATARRMKLDASKVMLNISKYGNTTSATIPLLFADYEKELKKGDTVIVAAFGGGFSWGAIYFKWCYNS